MTSTPQTDDWVPVRRDDGELIGFLAPEGDGWAPLTVFGHPIAEGEDRAAAEERLQAVGMSYLAEKWEVRDGAHWISAQVVEASPSAVTVQLVDFFDHADRYGERLRFSAPVESDRLRLA